MATNKAGTVDEYIASFPPEVQAKLQQMRKTIRSVAPDADEVINYAIPTYKLHGNLIHFAGLKNHIGFYPGPDGIAAFQDEFSKYKWAKGSVQFPLDQPLPIDLVKRIVKFRVKQNMKSAK